MGEFVKKIDGLKILKKKTVLHVRPSYFNPVLSGHTHSGVGGWSLIDFRILEDGYLSKSPKFVFCISGISKRKFDHKNGQFFT